MTDIKLQAENALQSLQTAVRAQKEISNEMHRLIMVLKSTLPVLGEEKVKDELD